MEQRQQQEEAELAEKIAKEVEGAVNGALEKMAEDLADLVDRANEDLNEALEDFIVKEDEAIDQIDEMNLNALKKQK